VTLTFNLMQVKTFLVSSSCCVTGILEEVIFEAKLIQLENQAEYKPDEKFINGLPNFKVSLREHIQPISCDAIGVVESGNNDLQINLFNLPPGSVIAFR
jgi:Central domain of human glycogen debranching enzyme